jgi:HEPN domain-containing protein
MDKIKGKYEVILGFVTLVISLSAFKDELSNVILNLGYFNLSLSNFLLYVVYGFSICLYLYIIEKFLRDTKIGSWKIFDYILKFAYFLFIFILLSPLLIILNLISLQIYLSVSLNLEALNRVLFIIMVITSILAFISSAITSQLFFNLLRRKNKEEVEEQEIKELYNANKLFEDGHYSHSLLEIFKALESHLYKKLIEKEIRVQRHNINEIINIALKENIINKEDLSVINKIREMRHIIAHSDVNYTKIQANYAIDFLKELIKKDNSNNQ